MGHVKNNFAPGIYKMTIESGRCSQWNGKSKWPNMEKRASLCDYEYDNSLFFHLTFSSKETMAAPIVNVRMPYC